MLPLGPLPPRRVGKAKAALFALHGLRGVSVSGVFEWLSNWCDDCISNAENILTVVHAALSACETVMGMDALL